MAVDLSVVVPLYNEAGNVGPLLARLLAVLSRLGPSFEVLFVNDGSRDDTVERVLTAAREEPRVKLLDLSRNFGKEAALSCGLAHARGRAVVLMDGDLQHPPEVIPALLDRWREGYEMVYAQRCSRDDQDVVSRAYARSFYWLFDRLSEVHLPRDAGDFRLLDRKVVEALNALPERNRFMKGIFAWVGFRSIGVPFEAQHRESGSSKWSRVRQLRFALDGITAFSNLPLRVWGLVGAVVSSLAFLYIVFRLLRVLFYGVDVPGYESILAAILFLGGVQLMSLGIIGDYLGRVFDEAKRRPLYIVRARHGLEHGEDQP